MRRLLLCLLVFLPGCATTTSVLVPMALNPIPAPSRGIVEVHGRATVNTGVEPTDEPADVALYLPRAQMRLGAGVRLHELFTLRAGAGSFLDVDAQRVGSSRSRAPNQAGYFVAIAPTLTIPLDHGRTLLTVGPDFTFALLPRVRRYWDQCVDASGEYFDCSSSEDELTGLAMVFGGTFGASRWLGDVVRITGTVGMRGQPAHGGAFAGALPSDFGHVAAVLGAEVLFQVTEGFSIALESQWIGVAASYVVYPTVGLTLGGTFGHWSRDEDPIDATTWDLGN